MESLTFPLERLRQLVLALDVPDCHCEPEITPCSCPPPPDCECESREACTCERDECNCPQIALPCHHILATDHGLSLEDWAELLARAFSDEYAEPPPPVAPAVALSRQARVAVLEERYARGKALRHPLDSWRQESHVEFEVEVQAVRLRNGAVDPRERLTARCAAAA